MSVATSIAFKEGDVIAGKYRVERTVGSGAMGLIVAAHHLELDERVALKFLLAGAQVSPEGMARFVREARAAVKIKNEHVGRVMDVGQLEDGSPYIVMEYLDGIDLEAWLSRSGPLPCVQAVDFVLQACEAIAEAHALGMVHRDLKPANLFCVERKDGQSLIKVLDFGISKVTGDDGDNPPMTRTHALMGSPRYMSPEQMTSSRAVDARSDIWSLGIILFELLTARGPFDAESASEIGVNVMTREPSSLRACRPDLPAGLESVVAKCLAKDRNDRPQTVADLALLLREFAPPHAILSIERILGLQRLSDGGNHAAMPQERPREPTAWTSPAAAAEVASRTTAPRRDPAEGAPLPRVAGPDRGVVLAIGIGMLLSVMSLGAFFFLSALREHKGVDPKAALPTLPGALPVASVAPISDAPISDAATSGAATSASSSDASERPSAAGASAGAMSGAGASTARPEKTGHSSSTFHSKRPFATLPTSQCDPPYYLDERGSRVLKEGCE